MSSVFCRRFPKTEMFFLARQLRQAHFKDQGLSNRIPSDFEVRGINTSFLDRAVAPFWMDRILLFLLSRMARERYIPHLLVLICSFPFSFTHVLFEDIRDISFSLILKSEYQDRAAVLVVGYRSCNSLPHYRYCSHCKRYIEYAINILKNFHTHISYVYFVYTWIYNKHL